VTSDAQRARRPGSALLFLATLLAAAAASGCASEPDLVSPLSAFETPLPLLDDASAIFTPGEALGYDVRIGPFDVGTVEYRTEALDIEGRAALRFEGVTRPRGLFAAFAKAGSTRVIVDRATLAPSSAFWITADRKDPMIRVAAFDRGLARTAVYQDAWSMTRTRRGATFYDPVSSMMLLRALAPPAAGEERRLLIVEGVNLHLLTVRVVGAEPVLLRDEKDPRAALKLAVRGDLLSEDGDLDGADPLNNFFVWLAQSPRREPLKIEGRIAFGGVSLTLRPREGAAGPQS
jgi:hypothetical protein